MRYTEQTKTGTARVRIGRAASARPATLRRHGPNRSGPERGLTGRRRVVAAVLLGLAVWHGALISPAASAAAGRTVAVKHTVLASFSVVDPAKCVTTSVFVSADTSVGTVPTDPRYSPPGAQIALTRVDACAKRTLLSAAGSVAFEDDELEMTGDLEGARLRATVPATNAATGARFETRIDLVWMGKGPVEASSGSPAPPGPGPIPVASRFREATVTGSVSDGKTGFAPGPAAVASMMTATYRPSGTASD